MLQKLLRGEHRTACGLRPLNACSRRQAAAARAETGSPPHPTFAHHVLPCPLARASLSLTPAWSRCPRPLSTGADVVLHDFSWNARHVTSLACFLAGWGNSTLVKFQCEQPSQTLDLQSSPKRRSARELQVAAKDRGQGRSFARIAISGHREERLV